MIARCEYCKSIWVCWNWFDSWGGKDSGKEENEKRNPHIKPEDLKRWCHECWNCGDSYGGSCQETFHKVRNGVPYRILRFYGFIKYTILGRV